MNINITSAQQKALVTLGDNKVHPFGRKTNAVQVNAAACRSLEKLGLATWWYDLGDDEPDSEGGCAKITQEGLELLSTIGGAK